MDVKDAGAKGGKARARTTSKERRREIARMGAIASHISRGHKNAGLLCRMTRILIESPFAGDFLANAEYAKQCVLDCLRRGEAPYASHLFFPQILDDLKPDERKLGIDAGLTWGEAAEKTVVYTDRGISHGMEYGIERAKKAGRPVEYRSLKNKS